MARNQQIYGNCSLYVGVTSITTAPYGGTYLGYSADGFYFNDGIVTVADTVSEQVAPDDIRDMGAAPSGRVFLYEWTKINMQNLFNNGRVEALAGGTDYSINFPSDLVPGAPIIEQNLLVVPEDPDLQFAIYFPAAKAYKLGSEMQLSLGGRTVLPVEFVALYKKGVAASHVGYKNRQCQIAKLSNIRLIL